MADVTPRATSLTATDLEREHVHKVYDVIARHFSHTRHHPWPQVTEFLAGLAPRALVADMGCGNGKYLHVNPSLCVIGADRSIPLMQVGATSNRLAAVVVQYNCNGSASMAALNLRRIVPFLQQLGRV